MQLVIPYLRLPVIIDGHHHSLARPLHPDRKDLPQLLLPCGQLCSELQRGPSYGYKGFKQWGLQVLGIVFPAQGFLGKLEVQSEACTNFAVIHNHCVFLILAPILLLLL